MSARERKGPPKTAVVPSAFRPPSGIHPSPSSKGACRGVLSGGLGAALADPAGLGVGLGLVLGKLAGVFGSTYLLARFTRATPDSDLSRWDVLGISLLAGVGFTVSLLYCAGATASTGRC